MKSLSTGKMAAEKRLILTDDGEEVYAVSPVIISASRATDIPAFYPDWFVHRLEKRYARWINSFNPHLPYYISFDDTRAVVFWSKNPLPLLPYLDRLDSLGLVYYLQFTLTSYGPAGLEPGLPPLDERISTFIRFSDRIGYDRVIWRFDPVLLTNTLGMKEVLSGIEYIGKRIAPYTKKFVFSFVDTSYSKVKRQAGTMQIRAPIYEEKLEFIKGITRMNRKWNLSLAVCADNTDYGPLIEHNRCIDDTLLRKIDLESGRHDGALTRFLETHKGKDPGQRLACRCVKSKDIGQYDTCLHGCVYCYATDHAKARINAEKHALTPWADTITGERIRAARRTGKDIQSSLM